MPSYTSTPLILDQPHYSEEERAEDFGQDLEDVSQEEEDTPHDPIGFPREAVELLEARWPAWKEADKDKRRRLWKALRKDLKALSCHNGVRGNAWKLKAKTYHKWLQNKGRVRSKKKSFYIGRRWTTRRVLEDRYKQQVIDLVKERNGGSYVLQDYQPTLNNVLADVTSEEKAEAKLLAQEWNTSGGPGEVQTRFTKKNIYTVTKHFAEEMWKKGGVRMVIMSGWRDDESGEIFSVINDFNPEIANGPMFEKEAHLQRLFEPYLRKCFGDDDGMVDYGHGSEDEEGESNEQTAKEIKTAKKKVDRDEHVRKVIGEDGVIRVPEFDRGDRIEMLSLIRGFLTAHYRRACGNPKAAVPFTKLSDFNPGSGIVDIHHVPFGWTVPRDPSKIPKQEAWNFLCHVQRRQDEHGEDVFRFNKWIDAGGHLQRNVEDPEFNPADVTKRPKPRPRPRVRSRRAPSDSSTDSQSSKESDEREQDEDVLPEQGPSTQRKIAPQQFISDPRSDDDSDDSQPAQPHPKGKGKEVERTYNRWGEDYRKRQIEGRAEYPDLPSQVPSKSVSRQGLPKPQRQLLKPALKRTYGSQSDLNRITKNSVPHSDVPEHSDTDNTDVDNIQKALVNPHPSEDAGYHDESDSMPVAKPKLPRQTMVAQAERTPTQSPTSLALDNNPRKDIRESNAAHAPPAPERRSNRNRRAPLPRDADVHLPQRAGAPKRKVSGTDRTGKKRKLQ